MSVLICIFTFAWSLTLHLGVPDVDKVVNSGIYVDQFGRQYSVSSGPHYGPPVVVLPFVISVSKYENTLYHPSGRIVERGTKVGREWYLWFGRTWPNQMRIFLRPDGTTTLR